MAAIRIRDAHKTYDGGVDAVRGFTMDIEHGEFIILVGPSGCGKSTMLRMIAGLEEITEGEIHIGERLVNGVPAKDRDIAMVFQDYALYPHMTVEKNMSFSLKLRHLPKESIRARVREVAEQLELTDLLHRKPAALSGGQRQRVALGRAMVRDPAVFLFDEPLSNLDARLRTAMRAQITQLHKSLGGTFLYVTHDQTEAMTMADRIVVMKDGLIQQVGTPEEVYRRPANRFVAEFIGSPQMNLLPARLGREHGALCAHLGACALPLPGAALEPHLDSELLLGVRPEALRLAQGGEAHTLDATLELAELLGPEMHLHLDLDGHKLIARTPPTTLRSGERVRLALDAQHLHLFDAESGRTLYSA